MFGDTEKAGRKQPERNVAASIQKILYVVSVDSEDASIQKIQSIQNDWAEISH